MLSQILYSKIGAKMVVGMPFKDIATSDTLFMREVNALLPLSTADSVISVACFLIVDSLYVFVTDSRS